MFLTRRYLRAAHREFMRISFIASLPLKRGVPLLSGERVIRQGVRLLGARGCVWRALEGF
jgi:hypothetical protein